MPPVRGWGYRLYKISLPSALVLCAPIVVAVVWYAWSAFAQLDRYRRFTEPARSIDAELLQIALHDELTRDVRRFFLKDRPADSRLPTFELSIPRDSLDALGDDPVREGKGSYVKAFLRKDGTMHSVRVRYRGRKHWHRLGAQKSMKIRVDKGDLIDGIRVFNLFNDVTPFGLEEELILDLAREHGLMAPEVEPIWLRLNNGDMGIYRYEAQPAEGLIRRNRRMPGSIYSGNSNAQDKPGGVGALFGNVDAWRKAAWKTAEEENDLTELERLLYAVRFASHREFRIFAQEELDLQRFALFDALDVIFGGDQHDFLSNHKLYFDPYRGRFEPIAWNFRAFTNDPRFNLTENPLLLRLKALPDFVYRRDRLVHELLLGDASVPAIRARVNLRFAELSPELAADPYWDAYKLLPRTSRFARFMVRPMTTSRWLTASRAELNTFAHRSRYLLDVLERPGLAIGWSQRGDIATIEAVASDHGAWMIRNITVTGDCAGRFALHADVDLNGLFDPAVDERVSEGSLGTSAKVRRFNRLIAGMRLTVRPDPSPKHGTVLSERTPRAYRFFLTTHGCSAGRVMLELDNLITGASSRHDLADTSALPTVPAARAEVKDVPSLRAGEESPHPWAFEPEPLPEVVRLGPGRVDIAKTRVFEAHQTVQIAAGTQLVMGPKASLIFLGPLHALGSRAAPIQIGPANPKAPFGGLALIGPATAGSRADHLYIEGGTKSSFRALDISALLTIYDTHDIQFDHVSISGIVDADDIVRATYVDDLRLRELTIRGAPVDAIDIEMSQAEIRGARIILPGDECLDLMGSRVRIYDSLLIGCRNNAISAGEQSDVAVHGVVIADSDVGVLAKNASSVRISRSLIYRTRQALRTNKREVHYDAPSDIGAQDLFAVDCDKVTRAAKQTRIETGPVHQSLPDDSVLSHLRRQVLSLPSWADLDNRLAQLVAEEQP